MEERDFREEKLKNHVEAIKRHPVQAFVDSMAMPGSVEEVLWFMKEWGRFNPEDLYIEKTTEWSVPRWCKKGDIVLFMYTVTSNQKLSRVKSELAKTRHCYSASDLKYIDEGIRRGEELYKQIGGKVFALGVVSGNIILDDRAYAPISVVTPLKEPISYSEFKKQFKLSTAGSITAVYGDDYEFLKQLISEKNEVPRYFVEKTSSPIREDGINRKNWLEIASFYRFHYTLESQFRKAYVDYFLKAISDDGRIYSECKALKANGKWGFADNVILFDGKYLPVEVKLNRDLEKNLSGQCAKYCNLIKLDLNTKKGDVVLPDKLYTDRVLVIDTFGICMYYDNSGEIRQFKSLEEIATFADVEKTAEDIRKALKRTEKRRRRRFSDSGIVANGSLCMDSVPEYDDAESIEAEEKYRREREIIESIQWGIL